MISHAEDPKVPFKGIGIVVILIGIVFVLGGVIGILWRAAQNNFDNQIVIQNYNNTNFQNVPKISLKLINWTYPIALFINTMQILFGLVIIGYGAVLYFGLHISEIYKLFS